MMMENGSIEPEPPEYGILAGFETITTSVREFGTERILHQTIDHYHQGGGGSFAGLVSRGLRRNLAPVQTGIAEISGD